MPGHTKEPAAGAGRGESPPSRAPHLVPHAGKYGLTPKPVARSGSLLPQNEEGRSGGETRAARAVRAAAAPGRRRGGRGARPASHLRRFVCGGGRGGCGGRAGRLSLSRAARPGGESRARRRRRPPARARRPAAGPRVPPAGPPGPHGATLTWLALALATGNPGRRGGRGDADETRAEGEARREQAGWGRGGAGRAAARAASVTRGKSRPAPACVKPGAAARAAGDLRVPAARPASAGPARSRVAAARRPRPAWEGGGPQPRGSRAGRGERGARGAAPRTGPGAARRWRLPSPGGRGPCRLGTLACPLSS